MLEGGQDKISLKSSPLSWDFTAFVVAERSCCDFMCLCDTDLELQVRAKKQNDMTNYSEVTGSRKHCTYYGNFLLKVIQILASLLLGRLLLILVLRGGHAVAVRPSIL